jgi:hypothetical protein
LSLSESIPSKRRLAIIYRHFYRAANSRLERRAASLGDRLLLYIADRTKDQPTQYQVTETFLKATNASRGNILGALKALERQGVIKHHAESIQLM